VGDRLAFLDGKNAGLLAAVVLLPILLGIVAFGPFSNAVDKLERERTEQIEEIEALGQRVQMMEPLDAPERTRLTEIVKAFQTNTVPMGENANPEVVREAARLLETSGISRVRVVVEDTNRERSDASREPLSVVPLKGGVGFLLKPHPVRVQVRAPFSQLRRALDYLGDPSVPVQVERMTLVRDGSHIRADLEFVYWSREEPS
jgi:hypothetical protein